MAYPMSIDSQVETALSCRQCIEYCRACIKQCQDCPNRDAVHDACVQACEKCITACTQTVADIAKGDDFEIQQSCTQCAKLCMECVEMLELCAETCSMCKPVCENCSESCGVCAEMCNQNTGNMPMAESVNYLQTDFSFTELSDSHKAIDGLAANHDAPFISMHGEEVYILTDDLAAYIENTLAVIESTKTESGEIVGLPIDTEGHNHKGGAGWIIGLELDKARNVIRFLVNWTEKGIELIKGNLSRFFSPSVDTENRIILGGSLTNWPATRNAKGQILLRPVELSQSIKEIDMEKTLLEVLAELPGKVAEAVRGGKQQESPPAPAAPTELEGEISPQLKEFLRTPEGIDELGKKAQDLAREAIHMEKRKMHTVQFASKLAGGTAEHPVGLKVRPNEIVALLLSLPEPQALVVEKVLGDALNGAINFSMRGVDGDGFIQKLELPAQVKHYLKTWVDAGKSVNEFFNLNLELGNPEDYNLKEFAKKES